MRDRDIDAAIASTDPVDRDALERLDLDAVERELLSEIVREPQARVEPAGRRPRARRRRLEGLGPRRLALAVAVCVAAALTLIGLGSAGSPAPALGATRDRLARVSPHVLLTGPDWKAEAAFRVGGESGIVRFHRRGSWTSYLGGRLMTRTVQAAQLEWRSLDSPLRSLGSGTTPVGTGTALGATARIYARTTPGRADREYFAVWTQAGRELVLRSVLPSLDAFQHRLAALHRVGREDWLAALPRRVLKEGGWIGSERWGEPPVRAVAVSGCLGPLPKSVEAHAARSLVRVYEHNCGR